MLLLDQLKVYGKRNRYWMGESSMYEPMLDTFLAVADCGKLYESSGTIIYFTDSNYEADEFVRKFRIISCI